MIPPKSDGLHRSPSWYGSSASIRQFMTWIAGCILSNHRLSPSQHPPNPTIRLASTGIRLGICHRFGILRFTDHPTGSAVTVGPPFSWQRLCLVLSLALQPQLSETSESTKKNYASMGLLWPPILLGSESWYHWPTSNKMLCFQQVGYSHSRK